MADRFFGWHTIFDDAGKSRTPYMTRIWIGRLRLHIFHRGDNDPDPHDHPWDFWTFPLTSYVEEVAEPVTKGVAPLELLLCGPEHYTLRRQVVRAFRFSYRPATHCHRVIGRYAGWGALGWPETDGRKLVTIVWRGRTDRKWGFLRNRDGAWCWTPWKEYIFGGGKHAPCEPACPPTPQPKVRSEEVLRAKAIEIICKEAEEMGFPDDALAEFRAGEFDGDDLLTLQAVERALSSPSPQSNVVGDDAEWIKSCTAKVSNAIGGGSELFTRQGDQYRLDIDFVCKRISEMRERQHEAMHRAIRAERALASEGRAE